MPGDTDDPDDAATSEAGDGGESQPLTDEDGVPRSGYAPGPDQKPDNRTGDVVALSAEAHDRLLWYQREGESLADTLERVTAILPGPADWDDLPADPEDVDESDWVWVRLKVEGSDFRRTDVHRPGEILPAADPHSADE